MCAASIPTITYRSLRQGSLDESPCQTVNAAVWKAFQDIMERQAVPLEIVQDGQVVMGNEDIFRQWYQYQPR
jgi:hypothetical protein